MLCILYRMVWIHIYRKEMCLFSYHCQSLLQRKMKVKIKKKIIGFNFLQRRMKNINIFWMNLPRNISRMRDILVYDLECSLFFRMSPECYYAALMWIVEMETLDTCRKDIHDGIAREEVLSKPQYCHGGKAIIRCDMQSTWRNFLDYMG